MKNWPTLRTTKKIQVYNQFIRQDLSIIVKNELVNAQIPGDYPIGIAADKLTDQISAGLQAKLDSILENTETKIMSLAHNYETSNIQLTNANMKEKLVGLLLTLKDLKDKPSRRNKLGDSLFTEMDLNDIAQILRLHFAPYKGLKVDSIERQVYAVNKKVSYDNPDYHDLSRALQKFFFGR